MPSDKPKSKTKGKDKSKSKDKSKRSSFNPSGSSPAPTEVKERSSSVSPEPSVSPSLTPPVVSEKKEEKKPEPKEEEPVIDLLDFTVLTPFETLVQQLSGIFKDIKAAREVVASPDAGSSSTPPPPSTSPTSGKKANKGGKKMIMLSSRLENSNVSCFVITHSSEILKRVSGMQAVGEDKEILDFFPPSEFRETNGPYSTFGFCRKSDKTPEEWVVLEPTTEGEYVSSFDAPYLMSAMCSAAAETELYPIALFVKCRNDEGNGNGLENGYMGYGIHEKGIAGRPTFYSTQTIREAPDGLRYLDGIFPFTLTKFVCFLSHPFFSFIIFLYRMPLVRLNKKSTFNSVMFHASSSVKNGDSVL